MTEDVKEPEFKEEPEVEVEAETVDEQETVKDETTEEPEEITEQNEPTEKEVSDEDIEIIKARVSGQKIRIENLEKMLEEKAEDLEKVERLKNDFTNFKNRTQTERSNAKVKGKIKTVNEVLDVFDNLDRAMKFKSETEEFKTGLVMINSNLKAKLEQMGAKFEEQND